MESRRDLENRVAELERQLAALQGNQRGGTGGVRKSASWGIGDWPIYDIAFGPDLSRGEVRGHARGIIAIGDIATGFIALGGLSRGVIAFGGMAAGLISFGGMSIGALIAIGGLAVGTAAFGGGAVGGVALGGGAVGYYACGAKVVAEYGLDTTHRDPEAEAFFQQYGLEKFCRTRR